MCIINKIWEKEIPFKVSFFVWWMIKKRIHIGKFFIGIGVKEEVLCCYCDQRVDETYHHLFIACPTTSQL